MMAYLTIMYLRVKQKSFNMAEQTSSETLGKYKARTYTLFAKAVPSFNSIEKFAVNIHYRNLET